MSGILGQLAPTAGSWQTLYTVPANIRATLRVIVTNRVTAQTTFRVAVSPNGAAIANEHWIAGDKVIGENDTGSTIAIIVGGDDIVRVYAGSANLSFTATGETQAE